MPVLIQQKQIAARPHVGTIVCNKNRHIAKQLDTAHRCLSMQGLPVDRRPILLNHHFLKRRSVSLIKLGQCRRFAITQGRRPINPLRTRLFPFDDHETGVVIQPMTLRMMPPHIPPHIHPWAKCGIVRKQGGIDGKSRRALIRRQIHQRQPQGQHLPHLHAGRLQKIQPALGIGQSPRRQRCRMQQQARATRIKIHPVFLRMVPAFSAQSPPLEIGTSSIAGGATPSMRYSSRTWVRKSCSKSLTLPAGL